MIALVSLLFDKIDECTLEGSWIKYFFMFMNTNIGDASKNFRRDY